MALDSTATISQVRASYRDNSDYDLDGDVTKARAFVKACRDLLLLMLSKSEQVGVSTWEYDSTVIAKEQERALSWLVVNDPTYKASLNKGRVTGAEFTNLRGQIPSDTTGCV